MPNRSERLVPIHDFTAKLRQPSLLPRLRAYVERQVAVRAALESGLPLDGALGTLDDVPISLNLDLTTSCNYACDHCVDKDILNTRSRFDPQQLLDGLSRLASRGLRSVILIGGGEPTVYPGFEETVITLKDLGLQVGIVTNGSRMDRILAVADRLAARDWVRLSLDAGSDELFQAMHRPRRPISLDEICEGVPPVKRRNPALQIGYSFIIVWKGCEANDAAIHENLHEIPLAAARARQHAFDYISYKPFLTRLPENRAEFVGLTEPVSDRAQVLVEIRRQLDAAKELETTGFRVVESTNLHVLESGTFLDYSRQPAHCHMQLFRQVLSPLGLFNCPVYRGADHGRIANRDAYASDETLVATQRSTARLVRDFQASEQCRNVTCLYNPVNWFIEDLIQHPERLDDLVATDERSDTFL